MLLTSHADNYLQSLGELHIHTSCTDYLALHFVRGLTLLDNLCLYHIYSQILTCSKSIKHSFKATIVASNCDSQCCNLWINFIDLYK